MPDGHQPTIASIGTPLSPSATKVMLLGSGELGKEVIIALQRLGVEVVAVDRYANAPGHQVAHRAHVIAMTDGVALRRLIEQERPQLVVPEIEAIATDALADVERDGIAQVIPTARAVRLTMNREGIRRLAAEELGLPTSPYRFADGLDALEEAIETTPGIGYPCVVKPVMSSSGKGQSVVRSKADVPAAWQYAESAARVRGSRVIVEGFIDFDYEITLLTVRAIDANGDVQTHFCEPVGHVQVNGDYVESWQPQPMSAAALASGAGHRAADHRRARWPRRVRRRAFRQGRHRVVLGSESASARHGHGHDGDAGTERVRAACAGDPRPAGGRAAAHSGRLGGDLRRRRRSRHPLRQRRARARRFRSRTSASSASPRRTRSAAWAWRSPPDPTSPRRAIAPRSARGASSRARDRAPPGGRGRQRASA